MTLEELFQQAERTGVDHSFIRIDESHPVGIFVGLDGGRRCILVVCPEQPPAAPTIGALRIEARPRREDDWALTIRLERPDLSVLFTRLVEDLASATSADGRHPGTVVVQRLVRWQRLFLPARSGLFEDFELRGLIAELAFLIEEAVPFAGPEAALRAWRGPFDAPKDFVFADREIEIKATSHQPKSLHISSLEQLTDVGLPLYLWTRVVELDQVQEADPTRSAFAWVRKARGICATSARSTLDLEDRLHAVGWVDRDEYDCRIMRLGSSLCYRVRDSFPRLQRPNVPPGVLESQYRIDLGSLSSYVDPDWKGTGRGDGTSRFQ
ncbi:MAG: PD-(D/E)XK motif protein [Vicinamibacterales bacterium]